MLAAALAVQTPAFAQPDTIYLSGTIRDFHDTHPDFNVTDPTVMGHYVHNVASILGFDGKPLFTGGGTLVTTQWEDQFGNPIMPYVETFSGLPGGHFDVDVFGLKKGVMSKVWHKHEFDDAYNVTGLDIRGDEKLLYEDLVMDYPNDVRVEFFNSANGGGGSYSFKTSSGPMQNGWVTDGFSPVFAPSELTKFEVDFTSLALMRLTNPKLVQGDPIFRDDALTVRFYDNVTGELFYSISAYTHVKDGDITPPPPPPPPPTDSCGVALNDTEGAFGSSGSSGVTAGWSFDEWFHDVLGTNLSTHHTIRLDRDMSGVYEYCNGAFWPIDGRLFGNEGDTHNNFFTYNISATFTYDGCTGQFFEFEGNDDCWVYINDRLVIDLGGVATGQSQRVDLDRIGLTDGQVYTLDFFYAHRRPSLTSLFCMRTNIELNTGYLGSISQSAD